MYRYIVKVVEYTGDRNKTSSNSDMSCPAFSWTFLWVGILFICKCLFWLRNIIVILGWSEKFMQKNELWLFTNGIVYHWATIVNLVSKSEVLEMSKSRIILNYRIDVWAWHHPLVKFSNGLINNHFVNPHKRMQWS